jgi:LuxR family transcriptional regulator, quorum-sensing system regulator BjaR1
LFVASICIVHRDAPVEVRCLTGRDCAIYFQQSGGASDTKFHMSSNATENFVFDTILELTDRTSPAQIAATLTAAAAKFGFTALGINGLPAPRQAADPLVLVESTPKGFREFYIHERLYPIDHICTQARIARRPFRFSEAFYEAKESRRHRRFLQALQSYGMDKGMIVPVGGQPQFPACVWLAGENPDLNDEVKRTFQLIALFAAAKAYALPQPSRQGELSLSPREREVLTWTARGKSAWEIGEILGIAKRTVDAHVQTATLKLGAANKTQAAVFAVLERIIEI